MSFTALRPRTSALQVSTGALDRVLGRGWAPYVSLDVDPRSVTPIYAYHEGDILIPGAESFVFESQLDLPLTSLQGGGSGILQGQSYPMNAWPVYAAPPVMMTPMITIAGYGGLQAGAFVQQPLLDQFSENG